MPDPPARRHFAAIVNPISGRRSMLPAVERIRALIEQRGGRLDVFLSDRAGHATDLAAGLDASIEAVLIVGGDGTVGEVIHGLDVTRIPFLVLRTGTENLLARELGMPVRPRDVVATLMHGAAAPFDIGIVNGRRFASLVGVGFDAECVHRLSVTRTGHITHLDYFWPIWRTFWGHRFPRLIVDVDGARVFDGPGFVIAGNTGRYARNLRIVRHARWDDGKLGVSIFPCSSRWKLVVHAVRVLLRRHIGRGGVVYRECQQVRVSSPDPDVRVEVDGDQGGALPVTLQLIPSAARFLTLSRGHCPSRRADLSGAAVGASSGGVGCRAEHESG